MRDHLSAAAWLWYVLSLRERTSGDGKRSIADFQWWRWWREVVEATSAGERRGLIVRGRGGKSVTVGEYTSCW